MPRAPCSPVRANTSAVCAPMPSEIDVFSPLRRQPAPSRWARSDRWAASEPCSGSVRQKQRQRLAGCDRWKPALALGLVGGADEHLGDERRQQDQVGSVDVRARHLLGGDAGAQRVGALAAVLGGDAQPDQAHVGHVAHEALAEGAAAVGAGVVACEPVAGEGGDGVAKGALLVAEREVHYSGLDARAR